jgi:dolichyl-phosphate beta-glucosyltransferase
VSHDDCAISVIVPAFNEEARLPPTLIALVAFLENRGEPWEILVADDGSTDGTPRLVQDVGRAQVVLLRSGVNRGKGHAVRRGMLAARGKLRLMTDADLSTPIEELTRLEEALANGHDVAIGSRAVAGARIEIAQPWYRENVGRLYNLLVRCLAVPGIQDTQCGFKLFTAEAAEKVFKMCRLDGFSFDVEALFLARRSGFRLAEVPVTWRNDVASRVTAVRGGLAFVDVLRLRWLALAGRYGPSL